MDGKKIPTLCTRFLKTFRVVFCKGKVPWTNHGQTVDRPIGFVERPIRFVERPIGSVDRVPPQPPKLIIQYK